MIKRWLVSAMLMTMLTGTLWMAVGGGSTEANANGKAVAQFFRTIAECAKEAAMICVDICVL